MKYMNNGGFNRNPMMRTTLLLTMIFLIGFVAVNFLLFLNKMELTPSSIASYYIGSEEEFRPARSYQSMLEVTHTHLPMMAVVLLLLTHLIIFTPLTNTGKYSFILTTFISALLNEGSNYLIRFIDPFFAWLKIASFLTLQGCIILLTVIITRFMIHTHLEMKKETEDDLVELQ